MTILKKLGFALMAFCLFFVAGQTASAQTNQNNNEGVWDKITKAVQGESKQQSYYNSRNKQKVSVTVKTLAGLTCCRIRASKMLSALIGQALT